MRDDNFGAIQAAIRSARAAGFLGGSFFGMPQPIIMPGKFLPAIGLLPGGGTITTVAARYYIAPFWVERTTTFAGVKFKNSGAGDNGDKVKIAFFEQSASGGPGALAKDFGESTLTGASAIRTLASSWVATGPKLYFGELVTNNTCDLFTMAPEYESSSVGYAMPYTMFLPQFAADVLGTNGPLYLGDYVSGTYANFPEATSLAPTNSIAGVGDNDFPAFGLYV